MKTNTSYYLLALLTVAMWSTTFASSKTLLKSFAPETIMLFRFSLAWLALFLLRPRIKKPYNWRDEWLFLGAGITGCTFYFIAENTALLFADTITVGLVVAIAPLLTLWTVRLFDKSEKIRFPHIIGAVLGFLGVALISFNGSFHLAADWRGYALALAAAFSWAVYSVILKKMDTRYSPLFVTRRTFFYAVIVLLPIMWLMDIHIEWAQLLRPINYLNVLFLGLCASCLAYLIWAKVVRQIGAVKANNFIYLSPLFICMIGVWVMHETITPWIVAGGILVLAGVYVATLGNNK